MNTEASYNKLVSIRNFNELDSEAALEHIANLVDISFSLFKLDGLLHSIKLCEEIHERNLSDEQSARLHYFWANAYSNIKDLTRRGTSQVWDWEQNEIEKEIFHFRTALQFGFGEERLSNEYLCRTYTNLGNLMNNIGRIEEALEYWNEALNISPSFSMALGNRGYGLYYYASLLNSEDSILLLQSANKDITQALLSECLSLEAKKGFENSKKQIDLALSKVKLRSSHNRNSLPLGDSKEEIQYRKWCLNNRLFLNPLNSLGYFSAFAYDNLHIPSITTKLDEEPNCFGFFSQMKQEFVSTRYLYFEAINSKEPHFSDKDVLLANTFDSSAYSLAIEKLKIAFRSAYSIFDKIAFFINYYMALSIPDKRVSFRTIWHNKNNKILKKDFHQRQNLPLRGLYWLSKDLYEDKPGFKESIEPDAMELSAIRNHLEHKYLKVCSEMTTQNDNGLSYSIHRIEFQKKTLKLQKMVRAALIYLSLAIRIEEQIKRN